MVTRAMNYSQKTKETHLQPKIDKTGVHPRKLRWQWKMDPLKMYFLLYMGIYSHPHVRFRGVIGLRFGIIRNHRESLLINLVPSRSLPPSLLPGSCLETLNGLTVAFDRLVLGGWAPRTDGYVVNNLGDCKSPFSRVVGPLPNGLFWLIHRGY